MRCWPRITDLPGIALLAALALLAGCTDHGDRVQVRQMFTSSGQNLELLLHIQLPRTLRTGLQRGVALSWRLDVQRPSGRESHWRELRYSPLSRQYQVREPASGYRRGYPSRAAALAALERWSLPPGDRPHAARLRLDTTHLPAPLVLPALFDADWRLDSGWVPLSEP